MALGDYRHIHLVGIGGTGLSAIARVLLERGFTVSGSDRIANTQTDALARDGATIFIGHDPAHIEGADALLVTSAAKDDNPEIVTARARGIPILKRADILGDLLAGKHVIAVAGSHGKTTTTAMLIHIFRETGREPGYIVGAVIRDADGNPLSNAAWGKGDVLIIEADEYDTMFLGLRPDCAIVTNVDWDHPDFFPTPESFHEAFERFTDLLPKNGFLIACGDNEGARRLAARRQSMDGLTATYGDVSHSTFPIKNWEAQGNGSTFTTSFLQLVEDDFCYLNVTLNVPGYHNALNAYAAIIAAWHYRNHPRDGVPPHDAIAALATFRGTARRFDVRQDVEGIALIDDYAHNPHKIRAALAAARSRYPDRAIWAVWQPHTYTRTATFLGDYATAFTDADHVLVTPIYAARETPIDGVNAETVAEAIRAAGHPHTETMDSFEMIAAYLRAHAPAPAAILILSAGDAPRIFDLYLKDRDLEEEQG